MENNSATSTTSAVTTRRESGASGCRSTGANFLAAICGWYQTPIRHRSTIARNAMVENHTMLGWPNGTTINAASTGPIEAPKLPPT